MTHQSVSLFPTHRAAGSQVGDGGDAVRIGPLATAGAVLCLSRSVTLPLSPRVCLDPGVLGLLGLYVLKECGKLMEVAARGRLKKRNPS